MTRLRSFASVGRRTGPWKQESVCDTDVRKKSGNTEDSWLAVTTQLPAYLTPSVPTLPPQHLDWF